MLTCSVRHKSSLHLKIISHYSATTLFLNCKNKQKKCQANHSGQSKVLKFKPITHNNRNVMKCDIGAWDSVSRITGILKTDSQHEFGIHVGRVKILQFNSGKLRDQ